MRRTRWSFQFFRRALRHLPVTQIIKLLNFCNSVYIWMSLNLSSSPPGRLLRTAFCQLWKDFAAPPTMPTVTEDKEVPSQQGRQPRKDKSEDLRCCAADRLAGLPRQRQHAVGRLPLPRQLSSVSPIILIYLSSRNCYIFLENTES